MTDQKYRVSHPHLSIRVATPPVTNPHVAIGGLGGSGTRVFAATLSEAGIRLGAQLNVPLDNLWFTVLFKRADWIQHGPPAAEVEIAAKLLRRAMTTGLCGTLSVEEHALLMRLRDLLPPNGSWQNGARAADAESLINSGPPKVGSDQPWGWKEPNTHVFLPHLAQVFPECRYIHVVRDGLDMAFSKNTWQARHWSHLFGLPQDPNTSLALHQLRYWIAANSAAIDFGRAHMPGRFLVMSYEAYCADPERHWPRLRRFLDLPDHTSLPANLLRPTTIGRSKEHDISQFPSDVVTRARDLQAEIDALHYLNAAYCL
ncbi:sulfotransferase family protein [Roseovarius mucosus]|uniref:Sulfotransferase family protein n=1 Tax=Roseovarius mucosus TaxID=215743 RepID=A0A1V0RNW9_9RHOB|nr:sulfotransferase [Roseovarius mucosus]ARE83470.1 sulfotransferase family protein [Roseovarius mucosus]